MTRWKSTPDEEGEDEAGDVADADADEERAGPGTDADQETASQPGQRDVFDGADPADGSGSFFDGATNDGEEAGGSASTGTEESSTTDDVADRETRVIPNDREDDGIDPETTDEEPGERVGDVVDRLQRIRADEEHRRQTTEEGVLLDQLDEVEERLLAFGEALGGNPDTVADLPFTEESGRDGMPAALYVRHDREMLNQITSWLLQDQHIGLISPYGTGKTALREIVRRDLGKRDDFVITHVDNPQQTTPRGLYETVLTGAFEAGYEIDTEDYWQVRNGIPWATAETKQAVQEVAEQVRAEDRTLLLIVDEMEDIDEDLLPALQVAGDAGVRLFLTGTPVGKERLADVRATLDSRLRYYEDIEPFSPNDVDEYVARSLAHFRGEEYDGGSQDLFSAAAIADVHEQTGGNPREVRLECRDLFTRAAFVWYGTGQDVDRITVTPELRSRRFGMDR